MDAEPDRYVELLQQVTSLLGDQRGVGLDNLRDPALAAKCLPQESPSVIAQAKVARLTHAGHAQYVRPPVSWGA